MYFAICPMQLQYLIWLKKWLKMSLTTSNQPIYWYMTLISIKLHLMIGKNIHNAKTCFLQLFLCNYNV